MDWILMLAIATKPIAAMVIVSLPTWVLYKTLPHGPFKVWLLRERPFWMPQSKVLGWGYTLLCTAAFFATIAGMAGGIEYVCNHTTHC